jgi:hypothetical protein
MCRLSALYPDWTKIDDNIGMLWPHWDRRVGDNPVIVRWFPVGGSVYDTEIRAYNLGLTSYTVLPHCGGGNQAWTDPVSGIGYVACYLPPGENYIGVLGEVTAIPLGVLYSSSPFISGNSQYIIIGGGTTIAVYTHAGVLSTSFSALDHVRGIAADETYIYVLTSPSGDLSSGNLASYTLLGALVTSVALSHVRGCANTPNIDGSILVMTGELILGSGATLTWYAPNLSVAKAVTIEASGVSVVGYNSPACYSTNIYIEVRGNANLNVGLDPRTCWYTYQEAAVENIGDEPGDNVFITAFASNGADLVTRHVTDMRDTIERWAASGSFINPETSNPYNWTDSDPDNLYFCAMGDRTEYGATGGARYDWTRTEAEMVGTRTCDIDIGEIAECVALLEAAS